ncbi:hypothetical protein [Chelativorans salis]|uniref:Uncharacterized protein n=1 Tax=Chelativorans salis TaxID=2978478 RepID=A0ABT2LGP0_9HYPH|nr:hypothetical protein [Chelativorans sp. EGI FJ00035]MCT7373605.1 hypothetical protein [Chelativorans sp. EGI FJ00035]
MKLLAIGPFVAVAVLAASHADASSIVELKAMDVEAMAAEAVPGEAPVALSASVSVIGEPAVTFESTSAVEQRDSRRFDPDPLVIRGGLVGDPFVRATPTQPTPTPPRQASAPAAAAPATAAPLPQTFSRPQ